jgi:hypothetical protein
MTPADYARPLTANGEYSFPATIPAGNYCTFIISGNFSGAAVTPGYVSSAGVFTALGPAITVAAAVGPYLLAAGPTPGPDLPGQATPALSITGGVSPSISLTVTQRQAGVLPINADSIADALGYVPGPIETPESIVAKLAGQTFNPGVIVLPDFGASFGPNGGIGLRGGVLAVGNGVDTDDLAAPRRVAGRTTCNLNGTDKVSARFPIVEIPLTATEVVEEAEINTTGTVKLIFSTAFYFSEDPIIALRIGFAHNAYKTAAKTKWTYYTCVPTGTETVYKATIDLDFRGLLVINAVPGPNKVVLSGSSSVVVSDRWGGVAGSTFIRNPESEVFIDPTDTSVAVSENVAGSIWLVAEIVMGASGTNGNINFSAVYDLATSVVIP